MWMNGQGGLGGLRAVLLVLIWLVGVPVSYIILGRGDEAAGPREAEETRTAKEPRAIRHREKTAVTR